MHKWIRLVNISYCSHALLIFLPHLPTPKTLGSVQCDPESPPQPPALKCQTLSQFAPSGRKERSRVFAAYHRKPFSLVMASGWHCSALRLSDNWVLQLLAFKGHRKLRLNSSCEHAEKTQCLGISDRGLLELSLP